MSTVFTGPDGQRLHGVIEADPRGLSTEPVVEFTIAGMVTRYPAATLEATGWTVAPEPSGSAS